MKNVLIFLFTLLTLSVKTQGEQFNNAYGDNGFDTGQRIVQSVDNSYYVVGSTSSSSTGNTDILVLHIDEQGNQIWAQYYGTEQTDIGD